MNRCPACGATYADDARFCTKDGTRLVAAATPSSAPVVGEMIGQTLEGRYKVQKKLGEGGMAHVYLAEEVGTGQRYAIKVLLPSLSKDLNAMARLRREAELGGRLEHPNICHIIRLGDTSEGLTYIVMPYIDGEVLSDRTHRAGQLPPDEVARWVRDIAAGLQRAHELEIVHRDLKPENVMIARGEPERAVVMDFGLAKERRASPALEKLTATGIVLGTPEFMSPEQLRGKPLDGRSDVYSLALMTFEMLTGKLPFSGRTQQEMMINRLRNDPTPLREMRPDLQFSDAVQQVLTKGLARDSANRYPTAEAFADALTEAVNEGPGGMFGRFFGRQFPVPVLLLASAMMGCERVQQSPGGDSAARATAAETSADTTSIPVTAVQLGAFSDTANAVQLRDSLAGAGWNVYVRPSDSQGTPLHRVRVMPSRDSAFARVVADAFNKGGRQAALVRDVMPANRAERTSAIAVNNGTHGMAATVRWAVSGDRRALLAVEDPAGVEAEPVPDGFVVANEATGVAVQRDGVWDVAPSPDWKRVAAGLAFSIMGRERPEIPLSEWQAMARSTGLPVDSVKKGAFVSSAMSISYALAQPAVWDLAALSDSGPPRPMVLPMAGGWRVGWSAAGDALLVGTNPVRAGDDDESPSWLAVDLRGERVDGETPDPETVAWTTGPTLDISVPVDFTTEHRIEAGARILESGGGWVRVRAPGGPARVVGPGTVLAATAAGRFVLVLVPNVETRSYDHPARVIVYDLGS